MTKPNNSFNSQREHWNGGRKEYARPHKQQCLLGAANVVATDLEGNSNTSPHRKLQIEKSPEPSVNNVHTGTSNEQRHEAAQRGFFAKRTWAEVVSTVQPKP